MAGNARVNTNDSQLGIKRCSGVATTEDDSGRVRKLDLDSSALVGKNQELTIEEVASAQQEMMALIDWHLPRDFYGGELFWEAVGLALLARMRDIIDSMTVLLESERQSEALVLLRVLYEHFGQRLTIL